MQKYILLAVAGLVCSTYAKSQNVHDLVRESQIFYSGTAKTTALGGAVGALGGDMSAITINPAISSTYLQSEFSFSPDLNVANTKSKFTLSSQKETSSKLGLGNIGVNFVIPTGNDQGIVNFSFFAAYNRLNNFNQDYSNNGQSNSSLMDNFLKHTTSDPNNLNPYYERLAFETYLIDTAENQYFARVPSSVRHLNSVSVKGNSGEWTFGGGANINNILYLGGSVNYVNSLYERNCSHVEEDNQGLSNELSSFEFKEYYKSVSNGYNFKIGAILRPIDFVRLGVSIHSPTFFKINTEFTNSMNVVYDRNIGEKSIYRAIPIDNQGYELQNSTFIYTQNTPWRYTGSAAFIIGKKGFVSFDYERVDYTSMSAKSSDDAYFSSDMSSSISSQLKAANNFRFGAEYKVIDEVSLRAGYAYYSSPYSSNNINEKANTQVISGGIGYFKDGFFFDVAYAARLTETKFFQYEDPNNALTPTTNTLNNGKFVVTVGWRF